MGNIKVIKPSKDFEQVSGKVIREFSVDTVGIYAKLLTFGEKWELSIKGLAQVLEISTSRVRKSITELEAAGYIVRKSAYRNNRLDGWEYYVYGNAVPEEERSAAGPHSITKNLQYCNSDITENLQYCNSDITENGKVYIHTDKNKHTDKENKQTFIFNGIRLTADEQPIVSALINDEHCDPQHVTDWLKVRKKARKDLTPSSYNLLKSQASKSGRSVAEAVAICAEHQWIGFHYDGEAGVTKRTPRTVNPY